MPQFQYVALNSAGQEIRGTLEAADSRDAAAALRGQSLHVLELGLSAAETLAGLDQPLSRDVSGLFQSGLGELRPVRARDRIFFLQQMSLMLRNGLTILQALDVTQEQSTKPRFGRMIGRLSRFIQSGHSLSEAMARETRYFHPLTVKLIESAEASGELDVTLDRAATNLERRLDLRRSLLTSMTYPAVVVVTSIAVAVFLVWKVIPQFAQFFARRGAQLPWSTQLLMDLSGMATTYGPAILSVLAAAIAALIVVYSTGAGRQAVDRALLKIPVVGGLLTVSTVSELSQTLALLLESGVTLLESLRITSQVTGNRAFRTTINEAAEKILRGQNLADSLRGSVMPALVPHVVAVGERTGALAQVVQELGEFYDRELQAHIKRMTALVEPVMILIIGGMVGFVYFAFFQAVFQLALAGR